MPFDAREMILIDRLVTTNRTLPDSRKDGCVILGVEDLYRDSIQGRRSYAYPSPHLLRDKVT